jgi:hypothetical protein
MSNQTPETLEHVFFSCPDSQVSSQGLSTLSSTNLLTLDFDIDEEHHFPLLWITEIFLFSIWNLRVEKKKVSLAFLWNHQTIFGVISMSVVGPSSATEMQSQMS